VENQRNDTGDMGRTDTGTGSYSGGSMGGAMGSGSTGMGSDMGAGGTDSSSYGNGNGDAAGAVNRAAAGIRDQFSGLVDYFRDNGMQDVMDDVTSYVKSHPTQALIGAAVLGFMAGRMARRS